MSDYILKAEGIYKNFGGVEALKGVDFFLERGSVHSVMGENGAGKSTLMKILLGYYQPSQGTITVDKKITHFRGTADALQEGISMIYQELNLIPHMSVADNIFLGREPLTPTRLIDYQKMHSQTAKLFEKVGIDLSPTDLVNKLSVARRQLVEITKALSYNSKILIMDEPTSALSGREVDQLFQIIRVLNSQGVSIVYISHKLDEVYEICEDVTVLRDGELIKADSLESLPQAELISLMVGQEVKEMFPKQETEKGGVFLEVEGLTREGEFEDINFQLKRGEILGIAGLVGAGRTELMETLYGIRRPERGAIHLKGRKVNISHPKVAIKNRIAMVSEDRKNYGLVLKLAISHNIILAAIEKCCRLFLLRKNLENSNVKEMVKKLQVKAHSVNQPVSSLSGGNQQKVVVAKILFTDPEIIILDEPTRGIDVKTKSEIHALMSALAKEGKAVIMVSSEIPEIVGMSDRIIVMSQGKIAGEIGDLETVTQESILSMAMKNVDQEALV